jgi:hypothetical protein
MDLDSVEDFGIVRLGFGLALVVFCLGIGVHYAFNRALTTVADSMQCGFLVVDNVDSIVDGLDRLSLNQRSFFRTGDLRFAQDVYESVTVIQDTWTPCELLPTTGAGCAIQSARWIVPLIWRWIRSENPTKSRNRRVLLKRLCCWIGMSRLTKLGVKRSTSGYKRSSDFLITFAPNAK